MINHTEKLRETEIGCSQNMGLQKFGVKIIRLILGLWRNITQRNGGYGGVSKHTDGSPQRHSQCIEQRRLFASSISNLYTKRLS